jgi:hypothetical protein
MRRSKTTWLSWCTVAFFHVMGSYDRAGKASSAVRSSSPKTSRGFLPVVPWQRFPATSMTHWSK